MQWRIPLFDTDFGQNELDAVTRVLKSGWLTMGEETKLFEQEFASFLGVRHAFLVSNCTAALHLAHHVLGVGHGDEIVCPSLTFVATANTIVQTGATTVFADIQSLNDMTISPVDIEKKITARTKGITVMHYAGYPCAMDVISEIARRHNLYVVEDCAHSPGAAYKGRMTGSFGDIGCFSFFSNKNLSTGEGGMIVTNRDDLAEKIRLLRSHGMTTVTLDRHKGHAFTYDVLEHGFNYRSAEINAAIGRVQFGKLAKKNARRAEVVTRYHERLDSVSGIDPLFKDTGMDMLPAYHIFPILLAKGTDRNDFMAAMRDKGIQTSIHYRPIHTFTAYKSNCQDRALPLTDEVGERLVTLPLYPAMNSDQVDYVADNIHAYFSG